MAINFPNSPSLGQLYNFSGTTWQWSGEYWNVYSAQTGYITSVSNAGNGYPVIDSVTSNALTLKSFSGTNLTITDTGGQLNFYVPLNGGGGGQLYYFNISQTQSPYLELSTSATTGSQQTITSAVTSGNTVTVGQFLTLSGYPGISIIPGGIWSFYLHCYKQNSSASFDIYCDVYKRTTGGTETLLFSTDPAPVLSDSPTPIMVLTDTYFSGTTLDVTDRLLVNVRGTNTSNNTYSITFVSEGSQHYSYVSSPLLLKTTDIYVNSFDYTPSANTLTIGQTEGLTPLEVKINSFTGLSISNTLSATTVVSTYIDNYYLRDNTSTVSIDTSNRQLKGSDGSSIKFDWETMSFNSLTSNGFLKVSGGTGSIYVDTTSYTIYTGDGSLSGNRIVDIDGYYLNFSGSSAANNLYLSGGKVGIGTDSPQYTLDVSGNTRVSGDTQINGITVGRGKGSYITNTIFGFGSMSGTNLSIGGANNTVMGYLALSSSNVIGSQSVVIGSQSHPNGVSTSDSVIIGFRSLYSGTSNGNSVIIGSSAGYNLTGGTGNVFIGYQAGYNETSAVNKLYISNSSINNLIYGEFNNGRVGINTTSLSNAFTVSANTDPVKFIGLQSASDTSLLTVDGTGVVHTISSNSIGTTWSNAVSPLTASTNNGYITTASTTTIITLPSNASLGTTIEIVGNGTGFWQLNVNSGQTIRFGNVVTTATTAALSATSQGDCVRLLCTTQNTGFQVLSSIGNIFYS